MTKQRDMVCTNCGRRWEQCPNQQNHQPVYWSDADLWRTYEGNSS